MNVYFNEYNIRMGDTSYLPLVSGLLRAYAEQFPSLVKAYDFQPFIYEVDSFSNIIYKYEKDPHVAAFSLSMWNERLSLNIAAAVKTEWPKCLIVMGGAQCPHYPTEYMKKYPFIDVCVRAEGEIAFTEVLKRWALPDTLENIPNVTWRCGDEIIANTGEQEFSRDLDIFPSPYLEGLFDELVETSNFQAIIETNRGCPFHCTFCYWGKGGLSRKYKYHELERVYRELDWCAEKKIKYIFNADSNFGMNKRDLEIAEYLVDLKQRTGYPDKFRTCYGKNTDEKIFQIGALFHKNKLEKGITLARQSNDPAVLKNIKRGNISMDTYRNLQEKFNEEDIPIYSELILGLPGETTKTWKQGINELLEAGLRNQLFIYFCQVYPNTDLGDLEYQRQFGIETKKIELNEIHGKIRDKGLVTEYEEIIIIQDSMSYGEWCEMARLSWVTMLMHSLKLGYFLLEWLKNEFDIPPIEFIEYLTKQTKYEHFNNSTNHLFTGSLATMLKGKGRGQIVPFCGDIYWDVEEASFIACMENKSKFYGELSAITKEFLATKNVERTRELVGAICYQSARIPTKADFKGDKERFARESIMWGRKSGTMLLPEVNSLKDYAA